MELKRVGDFMIGYRPDGSRYVANVCEGERITEQSFKDACDINRIMSKWRGPLPPVCMAARETFRDVSNVEDFQSIQNAVLDATEAFKTLSANMRARFGHDVVNLIDFVRNPANMEEAIKLGLIDKDEPLTQGVSGVSSSSATVSDATDRVAEGTAHSST